MRWRFFFSLLLVVLIGGCVSPAAVKPVPSPTHTPGLPCEQLCVLPLPSVASRLSFATKTLPPSPTAMTCDVATSEYCVEIGFFVFRYPVSAGNIFIDPTYRYGSTQGGTRVVHHGVEFPYPGGTPVLAAADGTVLHAGDDRQRLFASWPNFYGNVVILEHLLPNTPYGRLYTLYAHLSRVDVRDGQNISAGEPLGQIGMSGSAVGSHLHFEVRLAAEDYFSTLNPELYLRPLPGHGALALRFVRANGAFVPITPNIQLYPSAESEPALALDIEPYATEAINPRSYWKENIGLGNLPAGRYRITYIYWGKLYEHWVVVEDGKLTVMQQQLE